MSPSTEIRIFSKSSKIDNLKIITTPGIFPKSFRSGGFSFLDTLFKLKTVLYSNFDVIQVTNGHRPSQFIASFLGKLFKGSLIVDECWEWLGKGGYSKKRKGFIGHLISLYDNFFELLLKQTFDHIVTISSCLKNRFKNNSTVLHGGSLSNSLKDYNSIDVRKELEIKKNIFLVGMSNVIPTDHEDNIVFFRALEVLTKSYSDLFLLVTGTDNDYIDNIKDSFHFSKRIIFPGWVSFDKYNKILSSCNIFVLPISDSLTNRARWPNKLGDYFCLNRPVITNPTGDIPEYFSLYKLGLLCDHSPEGFINAISEMYLNRVSLNEYNKDSIYVSKNILSFEKRIDRLDEIFTKLIHQKFLHP
jgi:glycosyltransferase involved in cell wall biosynthesis